jgi:hypothetical protein
MHRVLVHETKLHVAISILTTYFQPMIRAEISLRRALLSTTILYIALTAAFAYSIHKSLIQPSAPDCRPFGWIGRWNNESDPTLSAVCWVAGKAEGKFAP